VPCIGTLVESLLPRRKRYTGVRVPNSTYSFNYVKRHGSLMKMERDIRRRSSMVSQQCPDERETDGQDSYLSYLLNGLKSRLRTWSPSSSSLGYTTRMKKSDTCARLVLPIISSRTIQANGAKTFTRSLSISNVNQTGVGHLGKSRSIWKGVRRRSYLSITWVN